MGRKFAPARLRWSWVSIETRRSGFCTGSGWKKTAFSSVKMLVFAPIPIASVNTATSVNPGVLLRLRTAKRISYARLVTGISSVILNQRNCALRPSLLALELVFQLIHQVVQVVSFAL